MCTCTGVRHCTCLFLHGSTCGVQSDFSTWAVYMYSIPFPNKMFINSHRFLHMCLVRAHHALVHDRAMPLLSTRRKKKFERLYTNHWCKRESDLGFERLSELTLFIARLRAESSFQLVYVKDLCSCYVWTDMGESQEELLRCVGKMRHFRFRCGPHTQAQRPELEHYPQRYCKMSQR